MGSISFQGFSCPNLLLVFLKLFLKEPVIYFFANVGTFSVLFFIFFCTLFWVNL